MDKTESPNPFFRVDLLTGCNNLVSFSDALANDFDNISLEPLSMIAVDVHQLSKINETRGRAFGDSLLRWFGFAIKDMTGASVYRIAGEDFAAVLVGEAQQVHADKAKKLFDQLNQEAEQFGLQPPVARITVLHFPVGSRLDAAVVWKYLNEKHSFTANDQAFNIIEVDPNLKMKYETAQAIVFMAKRITDLGYMLENTFGMAYTDPISGSPNMLAIQHKLDLALRILEKAKEKNVNLYLPVDSLNGDKFDNEANIKVTAIDAVDDDWMGLDIGEKTISEFSAVIEKSKTILWNGPMGVFEMEKFSKGTTSIAKAIASATSKGAFSLIGGGDSVAAVNKNGLADKVSYVSTGGGAMLEYMEGKKLPGIVAIRGE